MNTAITNIIVIGSSTVFGAGDPIGGGFVARLESWHRSADPSKNCVFNLGINGDKVGKMLQRGPEKTKELCADLVILYPGLNDLCRQGSVDSPPDTPEEQLATDLESLVLIFQKTAPVIIMSAPEPDVRKTMPYKSKFYFTAEDAAKMAGINAEAALKTGALFLDIYTAWLTNPDKLMFTTDGLHCNPDGHQALFEELRDFIYRHFISA